MPTDGRPRWATTKEALWKSFKRAAITARKTTGRREGNTEDIDVWDPVRETEDSATETMESILLGHPTAVRNP